MGNELTQNVPAGPDKPAGSLFMASPIYGSVDPHYFCALLRFLQEKDFPCQCSTLIGDSLVNRARNSITMEFLKSNHTHILFVDSDLVFSAEQVKRLMSHGEDIVGGFYPKKKDGDAELVFNSLDDKLYMDERGLSEVKYIGTGFMCISRRVFERMIEEYGDEICFKTDGDGKLAFDFWTVGVYKYPDGNRRFLSEDWYFCQRARDLGFKIWGDNHVTLRHSGNALYPLKHQEKQIFGRLVSNPVVPTIPDLGASPHPSPVPA